MTSTKDDIDDVRRAELRRGKKDQQRDDEKVKLNARTRTAFLTILRAMDWRQFEKALNALGLRP